MAKGRWMSDAEVQQIVQMRRGGVPVTTIAKHVGRSANYIYRTLKKFNTQQQQLQQEANVTTTGISATPETATTATATARPVAAPLQQPRQLQPNAALLCAVESMEVSPYEPIPMPKSVRNSDPRPIPGSVSASVGFTTEPPASVHSDDPPDLWLLSETDSSTAKSMTESAELDTLDRTQVQPPKKQKTQERITPSPSAPTSSALAVVNQPQRSEVSTLSQQSDTAGLEELLKRVQVEIRRLEKSRQADVYDAQVLQLLVKFHAEMLLVQLQKTQFNAATRRGEADMETSQLVRERLMKEIALLNVQADRERIELEHEQIKHKATTLLCRKRLLDAHASPTDVDHLFPRQ
ncbi:unnamed protein product [Phytophthora fragariaefolia]|uniref:Unnamed protein product n=1 Tax=Phytophthora fragariaefolia TaxID=1490495 RepID=A0A9W6YFM5_9STRA|nr:unnamed protein product [Phytophthora fragariaefolia]